MLTPEEAILTPEATGSEPVELLGHYTTFIGQLKIIKDISLYTSKKKIGKVFLEFQSIFI
jgi:hypothetical protein